VQRQEKRKRRKRKGKGSRDALFLHPKKRGEGPALQQKEVTWASRRERKRGRKEDSVVPLPGERKRGTASIFGARPGKKKRQR